MHGQEMVVAIDHMKQMRFPSRALVPLSQLVSHKYLERCPISRQIDAADSLFPEPARLLLVQCENDLVSQRQQQAEKRPTSVRQVDNVNGWEGSSIDLVVTG